MTNQDAQHDLTAQAMAAGLKQNASAFAAATNATRPRCRQHADVTWLSTVCRIVLICLPVIVPTSAASAAETVVFEDTFDGKLADGWTWIKQNKEAWRIEDGGLEFRVRGKDNVLARDVPTTADGPFAVEVTLTSLPQPTRQYEQGGFAWFHNGKQHFKYVKELIDGKVYVFPGKKEMPAATVQLRLEVRGDKFTALFRPGGKGEYQVAFSGSVPNKGEGKHLVGIMCYNGPTDAEHWMRFDDFRIVKLEGDK